MSTIDHPIDKDLSNLSFEAPPLTLSQMAWRRFKRHKLAITSVVMLVLLLFFIIGGTLFYSEADANFNDTTRRLQPPSLEHPFGTDTIGRDVLARTIYGGQISLLIGLTAVIVQVVIGVFMGSLSGYYGGLIDSILMRFTESIMTIPLLFLLLVMAKFFAGKVPNIDLFGRTFSGSVVVIVLIIGLTTWPRLARIVRAEFLCIKENDFVLAAHATGTPNFQIMFKHILPNTVAPIVVDATLSVAGAILAEAYISFLGLGVQPPTATWGNMITGATTYIEYAPWIWFFPGVLILLTVLSINFLGDGLRDALDPRSRPE